MRIQFVLMVNGEPAVVKQVNAATQVPRVGEAVGLPSQLIGSKEVRKYVVISVAWFFDDIPSVTIGLRDMNLPAEPEPKVNGG